MTNLRVGVAGLGTVGSGLVKLLAAQQSSIRERCGLTISTTAICAKNRDLERKFNTNDFVWHNDVSSLAEDANVDVVCELIGGIDGPALTVCKTALTSGKHVVTANKAMMAVHGQNLARLAEENGVSIHYEAAVAGGIPIVKAMREGLAGNNFSAVVGILNGTCNYILTSMHDAALEGKSQDFGTVLKEAQRLGYAEGDPSTDIDGIDAAHKLAILTSLAFGTVIDFESIHTEGIRHISAVDIEYAIELGYRVKLLAIARKSGDGVHQRVHPCMVRERATIAHVDGVNNAIVVQSNFAGTTIYEGPGAGGDATASAVASDLVDIARQHQTSTFSIPAADLEQPSAASMDEIAGPYYIRLMLLDKPGVIADIAARLRDQDVSVESMIQRSRNPGDVVPVVLTTHEANEKSIQSALQSIEMIESVVEKPRMIRIEEI